MELWDVSTAELDGWVAATLQPSTDFTAAVKNTVRQICDFFKEQCFEDEIRVFKTVKGGSAGKGTALRNNSDADVVIFLSCFSNYLQQRQEHPKILQFIENRLQECRQRLSFTVSISPPRYKGRSLSLTLFSDNESIEVDILPTYDALGQVMQDGPPDPQVYVDLLNVNSSPGEFSTCFTELQKKFVKRCPAKLKNLLRLVKHWYKQILKPRYPGADLPPKYALELLTIYAWEQGANSNEAFKLAEGFCTVLKLLCQYQDVCIYWERYYSLQHQRIGTHLKQLLRMPCPIILDPADPTGILGQGKQWDLVAAEAARCCTSMPCLTGIQPWNVQPAKSVTLEVKGLQGNRLRITVSPSTTILQLKEEIRRNWGISPYQQRLSQQPAGTPLILHDNNSLASYGIYYDTTLVLLHTQPQEMDILVKDIKGQTMTYSVRPTDTVLVLKKKINSRQGIPVEQQRLTYDSRNLEDHHKLEHYNVQPKSTIYLLLRLRGGAGPQHPGCQPS
ncbi:2'-5'-oligoadenylate synthase-like protein [Aythya fuligula]|uniref:2'-5'-oligoadenylate synthase-like protein n=1 Tax=Aythya fuligula TaxID=219594 RepID=A0A6J3DKH9_AYTFU|nr:2'-5'-oligoadenylate synthase-like protein [Aythya fuligula]